MEGQVMWPEAAVQTVEYPETDGLPMGETGFHVTLVAYFLAMLRQFFASRPDVYVGANMFIYYWEGDPTKRVAPDLFVVFGTSKEERRVWKVWEEERVPAIVLEFTSRSTWDQDLGTKKGLYEWLGVQEYFIFDPLQEYLDPALQGFRLVGGLYQPIEVETGPQGERQLGSEAMGLWLRVEGAELHLYERATGRKLLAPPELAAALQEAEARVREAEARAEAEAAARREAEARARAAEAELARLRAELEQLRTGRSE